MGECADKTRGDEETRDDGANIFSLFHALKKNPLISLLSLRDHACTLLRFYFFTQPAIAGAVYILYVLRLFQQIRHVAHLSARSHSVHSMYVRALMSTEAALAYYHARGGTTDRDPPAQIVNGRPHPFAVTLKESAVDIIDMQHNGIMTRMVIGREFEGHPVLKEEDGRRKKATWWATFGVALVYGIGVCVPLSVTGRLGR
jgi:hypothetical protein